jgi:hypothetical protein
MTRRVHVALIALPAALAGWLGFAVLAAPHARASHMPDFIGERMEVTQGTQDLNNSVPLVSGKRTFVRFYARVDSGPQVQPTNAVLVAQKASGESTLLLPLNPGGQVKVTKRGPIEQTAWLMRYASGDGNGAPALFELPADFRQGTVTLTAAINPQICFFPPCSAEEHNTANNVATTQANFSAVPFPKLSLHRVRYIAGGTTYDTSVDDVYGMTKWLTRAYPIPRVQYGVKLLDWGQVARTSNGEGHWDMTWPTCTKLNSRLLQIEGLLRLEANANPADFLLRVYGMIDDSGAFMRGCAPVPGFAASGPTGDPGVNVKPGEGWDFDGSYGDWYGGHELAHTYGRHHAAFCGAEGGVAYPYPAGRISPDFTFGNQSSIVAQIFGFDIATREIYGPIWHDLMTYCERQWMSDFTLKGLRSAFLTAGASGGGPGPASEGAGSEATPLLWVVASVNPRSMRVDLEPTFSVDPARAVDLPDRGPFAVVLENADGRELVRQPVPAVPEHPGPPGNPDRRSREVERLRIASPVPFADGARRLLIEGRSGRVLKRVRPGAASPNVEIIAPRGGESFDGGAVEVAWTASDADQRDRLTYIVQYRPGERAEWETVALPTDERRVEVPFSNLAAGESGVFRVLATDGLRTAAAESEPVEVVNRPPELEIVSPRDGDAFVGDVSFPDFDGLGQPVALEARAHDADTGAIDNVVWTSSLDGPLGTGAQLTVASLSEGEHTITAVAEDGNGGRTMATVEIAVVDHPGELPPLADGLEVEPREVVLVPAAGADRATLSVFERNLGEVRWRAQSTEPWLELVDDEGVTPAPLEVAVRPGLLPPRTDVARGEVVVTSPELRDGRVSVPIEVRLEPRRRGG